MNTNREEALKEFKESIAKELINEVINTFKEKLTENSDLTQKLILDSIKEMIEKNPEKKLMILQFELFRIDILNKTFKICLHGYDNLYYFDENPLENYIDLKFLFDDFTKLNENLITKSKGYVGKVNKYDVDETIIEAVMTCYKNMSLEVRRWLWDLDEEPFLNEGNMNDFYYIKWGEYQGDSEVVFAMDNREKSMEDFLKLKNQSEKNDVYIYSVWKKADFKTLSSIEDNLMFVSFKNSSFKDSSFTKCNMIMNQFKNSHIDNCIFEEDDLSGAVFENSTINKINFNNSTLLGTNFEKTKLCDVDFSGCDLRQASFINAKFSNVSFEGADLEEAIFNEEDIPFIKLSPEQLQEIYIYGGNRE